MEKNNSCNKPQNNEKNNSCNKHQNNENKGLSVVEVKGVLQIQDQEKNRY